MISKKAVEAAARAIYERLPYEGYGMRPPWVEGGNSFKQDEARYYARKALEAVHSLQDDRPLVEFARWVIGESSLIGSDLDGGAVQDKAEALGLIVKTQYDPAVHGDNDCDAQPGDDWFVYAPALIAEDHRDGS